MTPSPVPLLIDADPVGLGILDQMVGQAVEKPLLDPINARVRPGDVVVQPHVLERPMERRSVLARGRHVHPRIAAPPDAAEGAITPDDLRAVGIPVHAPIRRHVGQFPDRQEPVSKPAVGQIGRPDGRLIPVKPCHPLEPPV
ncbi:hypothetical protein D9M70_449360 [compost metagenome]